MPDMLNPNVNFLLNMNNMPHINQPPNMVPAGSLNIPRYEDTLAGRAYEDTPIGRVEEERYHIRNPTYVPIKFEPIKIEMPKPIKLDMPSYTPPSTFELFPKKNFWDKI